MGGDCSGVDFGCIIIYASACKTFNSTGLVGELVSINSLLASVNEARAAHLSVFFANIRGRVNELPAEISVENLALVLIATSVIPEDSEKA